MSAASQTFRDPVVEARTTAALFVRDPVTVAVDEALPLELAQPRLDTRAEAHVQQLGAGEGTSLEEKPEDSTLLGSRPPRHGLEEKHHEKSR